jgi:hypothetical protein
MTLTLKVASLMLGLVPKLRDFENNLLAKIQIS